MSQIDEINVALIGAGDHAKRVVVPALNVAGFRVRGVASKTGASAEALAGRLGARGYSSTLAMLTDLERQIDAVIIVLPPDQYAEPVNSCLERQLPVYCEKPVALEPQTLSRLEEHRARVHGVVMVGYMKRFAPGYRRAFELTQASDFGEPTALHAYWGMGPGFGTVEYFLCENAVHHLDLARYLMGEVSAVHVETKMAAPGSFSVGVLLKFESGAVGTLQMNTNSWWRQQNEWLSVTGRGATVIVDNVDRCTLLQPNSDSRMSWIPNYTVPLEENSSLSVMGFVPALRHFREVIRDGTPCASDLASAIRTTTLAHEIIRRSNKCQADVHEAG